MNNAELFEAIFGIYATELWAMEEPKFLEWLNAKAPEFKSDYISRDAAQDAMNADNLIDRLDTLEDSYSKLYARAAIRVLERIPAADVRPVVRGHWINYDSDTERYDDIGCSNCHKMFTVDAERFCDIGFVESDLNFCPNCGADMREADT